MSLKPKNRVKVFCRAEGNGWLPASSLPSPTSFPLNWVGVLLLERKQVLLASRRCEIEPIDSESLRRPLYNYQVCMIFIIMHFKRKKHFSPKHVYWEWNSKAYFTITIFLAFIYWGWRKAMAIISQIAKVDEWEWQIRSHYSEEGWSKAVQLYKSFELLSRNQINSLA